MFTEKDLQKAQKESMKSMFISICILASSYIAYFTYTSYSSN